MTDEPADGSIDLLSTCKHERERKFLELSRCFFPVFSRFISGDEHSNNMFKALREVSVVGAFW